MTHTPAVRPLAKDGAEPLYRQLYVRLRARIDTGDLAPGDGIPAESELMRSYGVSRITVRAALDQLVRDGLIERQRGRGSFVRRDALESRSCVSSFTDQMLALGREPTTEVLRLERVDPGHHRKAQLPFPEDARLVLIERLRKVDGEVAGLVRTYLPADAGGGLKREHFARTGRGQSLLYVLEHACGIVLDKGAETTQPVAAPDDVAGHLGCAAGAAVLLKSCTLEGAGGRRLLYEEAYWRVAQTQLVQRYPPTS